MKTNTVAIWVFALFIALSLGALKVVSLPKYLFEPDSAIVQAFKKSGLDKECEGWITRMAEYDYEWVVMDAVMPRWKFMEERSTEEEYMFYGSNLRFSNKFGVWKTMTYACLVDKDFTEVIVFNSFE